MSLYEDVYYSHVWVVDHDFKNKNPGWSRISNTRQNLFVRASVSITWDETASTENRERRIWYSINNGTQNLFMTLPRPDIGESNAKEVGRRLMDFIFEPPEFDKCRPRNDFTKNIPASYSDPTGKLNVMSILSVLEEVPARVRRRAYQVIQAIPSHEQFVTSNSLASAILAVLPLIPKTRNIGAKTISHIRKGCHAVLLQHMLDVDAMRYSLENTEREAYGTRP